MKQIIFIGKFNTTFQNLNEVLMKYFQVQNSIDSCEMLKGLIKVNKPDLVLVSLEDFKPYHENIIKELTNHQYTLPVVCIGTENEHQMFESLYNPFQFTKLNRPIADQELVIQICNLLGMSYEKETDTVRELTAEEENQDVLKKYGRRTILLVDDDPIQLRTIAEMLSEDFHIEMANSTMKALTMMEKKMPDLIILDYDMPVCDGKKAFELIQEDETARNIPVVFLTGVKDSTSIKEVLDLKPAAYMLKPANQDKLNDTIKKIFNRKAIAQ